MTMHEMDCAAFDERLADYLEGDLDPATRREVEAHVASCVRCTALVRDLEHIRAGASDLPELTPSRDLWAGIAGRIEAPVVPLSSRPMPNVTVVHRSYDRFKRAAIAAALVAVTAGVTYTLTVARNESAASSRVASSTATTRPDSNAPTTGDTTRDNAGQNVAVAPAPTPEQTEPGPVARTPKQNVSNEATSTATTSQEIDRLRSVFVRTRSQLDPRTAAIIEANLKVIDDAIAQSKAALAQDPASRFLSNQLNSALDKKLELLRTAALLPNRT